MPKGPLLPSSKVKKVGGKTAEKTPDPPKAKGDVFDGFREEGAPPPLWYDIHGLRGSGFDGMALIAKELMLQIKDLTAQLDGVKQEMFQTMKGAAKTVGFDTPELEGVTVTYIHPIPYLGTPKREKLVQLGIPAATIDKACDEVKPKPHIKINLPKEKE